MDGNISNRPPINTHLHQSDLGEFNSVKVKGEGEQRSPNWKLEFEFESASSTANA